MTQAVKKVSLADAMSEFAPETLTQTHDVKPFGVTMSAAGAFIGYGRKAAQELVASNTVTGGGPKAVPHVAPQASFTHSLRNGPSYTGPK